MLVEFFFIQLAESFVVMLNRIGMDDSTYDPLNKLVYTVTVQLESVLEYQVHII